MTHAVSRIDARPFFEKALAYGLAQGLLTPAQVDKMIADGPKGLVQIADHFGTAYLRTDLETAVKRMVNLISLYLEDKANGDLQQAALSLRDNSLLSHSKGGSEMLKRLHAMPAETGLYPRRIDTAGQKAFVNERSFAFPLSVAEYRAAVAQAQAHQQRIDFAHWLARRLGATPADYEDYSAEELIRSAMLVLHVGPKTLALPSKSDFIKLLEALRKKSFKPKKLVLELFLAEAPELFETLTHQFMAEFVAQNLPRLKSSDISPDELLHAEGQGTFFVRETAEEDVVAYDRLVAKEWVRLTKGDGDDPAVLATLFLAVATGHPPKASALLKEAKSIIAAFREKGFDAAAVTDFIDAHAPFEQREDLKSLWHDDLRPDAEIHLADNDPNMPDRYMERALRYFRQNAVAAWKGSSR